MPKIKKHICPPCDVKTMASRLGFKDPRRVQQLADEGVYKKDGRGNYDCPHNMEVRIRQLQEDQTTKASGLTKKQEERLEVQILNDKREALEQYGIVTQDAAIIEELAPVMVTFKTGIRELRSVLVEQITLYAVKCAEKVLNKWVEQYGTCPHCKHPIETKLVIGELLPSHELKAEVQAMLAKPLDDRLQIMAGGIEEWKSKRKK